MQNKFKRLVVATVASTGLVVSLGAPALAAGAGDGSNASPCGAVHGAFADTNGSFGYIGTEYQGAPNLHGGAVGQTPPATGYNNSHTSCQQ